jgi:hypothetical protein
MKKAGIVSVMIFLASVSQVFSQKTTIYPIPSYNISVYGNVIFQEDNALYESSKGKKTIHVSAANSLLMTPDYHGIFYVYSLDGQTTYGPYTIHFNETMSVEADDRLWGVRYESNCLMSVSVWVETGKLAILL